MKKKSLAVTLLSMLLLSLASCKKSNPFGEGAPVENGAIPTDTVPSLATARSWLADKNATEQTAALFYHLKKLARSKILFGHQDATKRGVTSAAVQWANEQHLPAVSREKSDVQEVTGAYPAVYGHDFLHVANFTDGPWFDYERAIARQLTIDAYNRGGINTYAWHYVNPVSKGSFYWNDSPVEAVSKILPGGSHHDVYKASLREVADFAQSLRGADGSLAPVIFRPFHEMDDDWFWWGKAHCTATEYKSLYRFTVTYLRDSLGVHNFLYAWSPGSTFTTEATFLERYPGDAYVDLVGTDSYFNGGTSAAGVSKKLKTVSDYAKKAGKLAALTETGLQNLAQADWYTRQLLEVLHYQKLELAYVLVWTNTKEAVYTPYKGHAAEGNFIQFKNDPYVLFGDELPKVYRWN